MRIPGQKAQIYLSHCIFSCATNLSCHLSGGGGCGTSDRQTKALIRILMLTSNVQLWCKGLFNCVMAKIVLKGGHKIKIHILMKTFLSKDNKPVHTCICNDGCLCSKMHN